jgi:hypothetical protein
MLTYGIGIEMADDHFSDAPPVEVFLVGLTKKVWMTRIGFVIVVFRVGYPMLVLKNSLQAFLLVPADSKKSTRTCQSGLKTEVLNLLAVVGPLFPSDH